jgi:hypothetical protein
MRGSKNCRGGHRPVDDVREFFFQLRQIFQSLAHAIVGDIVGGGLSSKITVVADILLE